MISNPAKGVFMRKQRKLLSLIIALSLLFSVANSSMAFASSLMPQETAPFIEEPPLQKAALSAAEYGRTIIWNYLAREMHMNRAAISGFMANIRSESGFRTDAIGDYGTSYGICQWHDGRFSALQEFADSEGGEISDIRIQLEYLKFELETKYPVMLKDLLNAEDSEMGAYQAAYDICMKFERPEDTENRSIARGYAAQAEYRLPERSQPITKEIIDCYMDSMSRNVPYAGTYDWTGGYYYIPSTTTQVVFTAETLPPPEALPEIVEEPEAEQQPSEQEDGLSEDETDEEQVQDDWWQSQTPDEDTDNTDEIQDETQGEPVQEWIEQEPESVEPEDNEPDEPVEEELQSGQEPQGSEEPAEENIIPDEKMIIRTLKSLRRKFRKLIRKSRGRTVEKEMKPFLRMEKTALKTWKEQNLPKAKRETFRKTERIRRAALKVTGMKTRTRAAMTIRMTTAARSRLAKAGVKMYRRTVPAMI